MNNKIFSKYELSRIRTYIRNLEGFRPDPLDDEPLMTITKTILIGDTGLEPVALCL